MTSYLQKLYNNQVDQWFNVLICTNHESGMHSQDESLVLPRKPSTLKLW